MVRLIFLLSLFFMPFAMADLPQIRILDLLPYFVQPPMVDPCLPKDFELGKQEDDPYFSKGYYWGSQKSLADFFQDPSQLKGCLIRAQVASTVKQLGHDRFSNDGNMQDLSAAGFTEIKVKKGQWGIFPYRELQAKGPKGRRYYQMWVGLNSKEGATLLLQFLYPEYLNEPTQTQKSIWENFVKKTDLMSLNDLMVVRNLSTSSQRYSEEGLEQKIALRVEKRRWDQKYLIQADNVEHFSVLSLKERSFLKDLSFGQPFIEIDVQLGLKGESETKETIRVGCQVVDSFAFESKMLQIDRFQENGKILLFY